MKKKRAMELYNDYMILKEESYSIDKAKATEEEAAKIQADKYAEAIQEKRDNKQKKKLKLQKFKKAVKDKLVEAAFQRIFDKCLGDCIFTADNTKEYAKSLTCGYVEEKGSDDLLIGMSSRGLLLSELADCIQTAYNSIMEDVDPDDENTFEVNDDEMDKFFDDLDMSNFDDVASLIKTRVNSAATAFVNKNYNDKIDLTDSMRETQEKIASLKQDVRQSDEDFEQVKESYMNLNRRKASKVTERPRPVYEQMVYTLTETVMKNDDLRSRFSIDGKLDMDKITENVNVMYTFLEMVNTLKIENVDEEYIKNVLDDMSK